MEGEYLKIVIPDWLASKLGIQEGTLVSVNNANGKFNMQPIDPKFVQ